MDGIDAIINKINTQADLTCEEIRVRACTEAEEKIAEITLEAEEEADDYLKNAKKAAALEYARILSSGRSDLNKSLLQKKQEIIDQAFQEALIRLENMEGDEAVQLISRLASREASNAREVLLPSKYRDIGARIEEGIKRLSGFSGTIIFSDDMPSGVVIKRGGSEYNMTFISLMRQCREEMESRVVSELFG